ncbi:MAG: AAA domain-containing protein [Candidatus Thiodiazotropha taylori]
MTRVYFRKTGAELEAIFKQNKGNIAELETLLSELQHRSRPKAKKLRTDIEKQINTLKNCQSPSTSIPKQDVTTTSKHQTNSNTLATSIKSISKSSTSTSSIGSKVVYEGYTDSDEPINIGCRVTYIDNSDLCEYTVVVGKKLVSGNEEVAMPLSPLGMALIDSEIYTEVFPDGFENSIDIQKIEKPVAGYHTKTQQQHTHQSSPINQTSKIVTETTTIQTRTNAQYPTTIIQTKQSKDSQRTNSTDSRSSTEHSNKPITIDPPGTEGKPSKFSWDLNDEEPPFKKSDSLPKKFSMALNELINELRSKGGGSRKVILEDGKKVDESNNIQNIYIFDYPEDIDLFEGAKLLITADSKRVDGEITTIYGGNIYISLEEDFGKTISSCILEIDETALLEALKERLDELQEGEIEDFNTELANHAFSNSGSTTKLREDILLNHSSKLNTSQNYFLTSTASNEVTFLWGPPGTGKTQTLGTLTERLISAKKRVLICSNTNQAVDQLLLKLCRDLKKNDKEPLEEGKILRLGKINHKELCEYSEYITPEGIIKRKSKTLAIEMHSLQAELSDLKKLIHKQQQKLNDIDLLQKKQNDLGSMKTEYSRIKTIISDIEAQIIGNDKKLIALSKELSELENGSLFTRLFGRSKEIITSEINNEKLKQSDLKEKLSNYNKPNQEYLAKISSLNDEISILFEVTRNLNARQISMNISTAKDKVEENQARLSKIDKMISELEKSITKNAQVLGSTITKTYLSHKELGRFDAVIVDEASMIVPASLYFTAGLCSDMLIISGDFRQLPPIAPTNKQWVFELLGKDIFDQAGIVESVRRNERLTTLTMLDEQYRMDNSICQLISDRIYDGKLRTSHNRQANNLSATIDPFSTNLIIIDTSNVFPFANRDKFKSHYNVLHALVTRNIVKHIWDNIDKSDVTNSKGIIGACTPFSAQAKLIKKIFKEHNFSEAVQVGTVHRYQGDEKTLMILDTVDSIGDIYNVGLFLQADNLDDSGSKLLNVAVSRAKEQFIVIANLEYLNEKLPTNAILRDILFNMQSKGDVIDAHDVLGLYPIIDELDKLGTKLDLSEEFYESGAFSQKDFEKVIQIDFSKSKKSIIIYSAFITPNRVSQYIDIFRKKIAEGVKVRCVTRPPHRNGTIPIDQGSHAIKALIEAGVIVDLHNNIHEKLIIIDSHISWTGSLNPLSHTSGTTELMLRTDSSELSEQLIEFIAIPNPRTKKESNNNAPGLTQENTICPECGSLTIYATGRYGPYFYCSNKDLCKWKKSLRDIYTPNPATVDLSIYGNIKPPKCPECSGIMAIKNGRWGPFFGCTNYPTCKGIVKIKKSMLN